MPCYANSVVGSKARQPHFSGEFLGGMTPAHTYSLGVYFHYWESSNYKKLCSKIVLVGLSKGTTGGRKGKKMLENEKH
jgi:hypothetical protein